MSDDEHGGACGAIKNGGVGNDHPAFNLLSQFLQPCQDLITKYPAHLTP